MVIIFNSEKARRFLLSCGMIFSFRKYKRKMIGKDWMNDKYRGKKIADVDVQFVKKVKVSELTGQYLKYSGFETHEEWLEEIKRLNHGILPEIGFIYKVKLLKCG